MTTIKLKSHNDLDGVTPGILAKLAFGDNVEVYYCSVQGIDKNVARFLEKKENEDVFLYITDISVNEENERLLEERYQEKKNVCLLDHHKTADHLNKHEWATVQDVYEDGRRTCAASLFYEHLVKEGSLEATPSLDAFVELVRQYDTWEWERNGNLQAKRLNDLMYMIGIDSFEERMIQRLTTNPKSFSFDEFETKILDMEEEKINRYIDQKQRQLVQTMVYDGTTETKLAVGIVHAENYHSEVGNVLGKNHPFLDAIVLVNVGGKKVSFRTIHDDVDVSAFAKWYSGGGHPKASGCSLNEGAFKDFVQNVFELSPRKQDADNNKYNVKASEFGTLYENHSNEITFILPLKNGKWEVENDGCRVDQEFDSFEEAELFAKKHYGVWLSHDNMLIGLITDQYNVNEQTLRSQFKKTMSEIL